MLNRKLTLATAVCAGLFLFADRADAQITVGLGGGTGGVYVGTGTNAYPTYYSPSGVIYSSGTGSQWYTPYTGTYGYSNYSYPYSTYHPYSSSSYYQNSNGYYQPYNSSYYPYSGTYSTYPYSTGYNNYFPSGYRGRGWRWWR